MPLAVLISALFLGGCAGLTEAQRQRNQLLIEIKEVSKNAQACYSNLALMPKYSALYANFALKRKPATPAELGNFNRISDDMAMLILDWYAAHQICDNAMARGFEQADGRLGIVAVQWLQDRAKLLIKVVHERPSYGEVNAELDVLKIREAKELKKWAMRTDQVLSAKHTDEIAQNQKKRETLLSMGSAVADALVEALDDLAAIQVALAESQREQAARQPGVVYVPIEPMPRFRTTSCSPDFLGGIRCTHY